MPQKIQTRPKIRIIIVGLVLFFCLFSHSTYAVVPTIGTITPSSGSTTPDVARSFAAIYTDTDGWTNLRECYFLVSASSGSLSNSSYLYYHQNTNLLYLRNDANTSWLGGYAPGFANTIENAKVRLNCALTTATGSATSLTIRWNVSFKPAYSGRKYSAYLRAVDDSSGAAGWASKGAYTVNRSPTVGTISPSSGTGQVEAGQTFSATYTDSDGWQNLQQVYLLINSSTGTTNCLIDKEKNPVHLSLGNTIQERAKRYKEFATALLDEDKLKPIRKTLNGQNHFASEQFLMQLKERLSKEQKRPRGRPGNKTINS